MLAATYGFLLVCFAFGLSLTISAPTAPPPISPRYVLKWGLGLLFGSTAVFVVVLLNFGWIA